MQFYKKNIIAEQIASRNLLRPLDVLLVGGTGTGKSSTLNAIFGANVAKVGDGTDPETKIVVSYPVHEYLRIHDSAGLGDGRSADLEHSKNITYELLRTINLPGGEIYKFMDLAMVILDGGSRDLGTAYHLLECVVLKSIEPERVIVAINQADMAMKGRSWNYGLSRPDYELEIFLEEKALSVQKRIKEATGLIIKKPVFYSALHGYNVDKLIEHVIDHLPRDRRSI